MLFFQQKLGGASAAARGATAMARQHCAAHLRSMPGEFPPPGAECRQPKIGRLEKACTCQPERTSVFPYPGT